MRIDDGVRSELMARFEVLLPHLNERQQRLALATEARLLGHGGVRAVAEAAGVSATTVHRGVAELEAGEEPLPVGRGRRAGGGRRSATVARSRAGEGAAGAGGARRARGSDVPAALDDEVVAAFGRGAGELSLIHI